jgi:hypothetical protein
MGTVLSHDEAAALAFKSNGRLLYPWHLWADGQWWKLMQGEDFDSTSHSFRQLCYRKHRYGKVIVHMIDGGVLLQVVNNGKDGNVK